MRSLKVAVIVKNTPASFRREDRNMGMWSYSVDPFEWKFIAPGKGAAVDTRALKDQGFDLVFHEDGGAWCDYTDKAIPTVYYAIDSTLSDEFHYRPRLEQARKADLVLVDHDLIERFNACECPVRRLSYCVNDWLFHPEAKTLDIDFHCGGSPERAGIRIELDAVCRERGLSYRSGAVSLEEYAADMNRAKVVVNVPRKPMNRPHRVFDALASYAALVTSPLPDVSGEKRIAGRYYIEAELDHLADLAAQLVMNGTWELLAVGGSGWASEQTWKVRAQEMRQMFFEEFGL